MKKIKVVAISLVDGGPLKILESFIETLLKKKNLKIPIDIYINSKINIKEKYNLKNKNIKFIKIPTPIRWISRIYYEFFYFKKIDDKNILWFTLQDIPLNLKKGKQVIYCHNPIHFYKIKVKDIILEPQSILRLIFYKLIYLFFLSKKNLVVVQQRWIKHKFRKIYNHKKITVAKPFVKDNQTYSNKGKSNYFFYPSLPRFQKNHKIIIEAVDYLVNQRSVTNFKVFFTIKKDENIYARYVYYKGKKFKQIKFIGRLNYKRMQDYYQKSKNLIFPSFLETWGLPLSEAAKYKMRILAIKLPYTIENLAYYKKKFFFEENDYKHLANLMECKILNKEKLIKKNFFKYRKFDNSLQNWNELIDQIVKKNVN